MNRLTTGAGARCAAKQRGRIGLSRIRARSAGGWLTIACVLNVSCALRVSGVASLAPSAPATTTSAAALLCAVALATGCTHLLDGNPVYAAALAWGFLGGAVGNLQQGPRSGVGPSVPHPTLGWACLLAAAAVGAVVVSGLARGAAQKWLPRWCCPSLGVGGGGDVAAAAARRRGGLRGAAAADKPLLVAASRDGGDGDAAVRSRGK